MKKIEEIQVHCEFWVNLEDVEVSDELYDKIIDAYNKCKNLELDNRDKDTADVVSWLSGVVKEDDAIDLSYDIELLNE